MTVGQIVALVLGIVSLQALAWIALIRFAKRRAAALTAQLAQEIDASGERLLRGPEHGVYRGGSGSLPRVKGNAVIALTDRRLVFAKLVGARVEVATPDILGEREEKRFLRSAVGGQVHLVLSLRGGDELGFFVRDREAWLRTLHDLRAGDHAAP